MKLARPDMLRLGAQGALLGALVGYLATDLGLVIIGRLSGVPCEVLGAAVGVLCVWLGWLAVVVLIDAALFVVYLVVACTPLARTLAEHWVLRDSVVTVDAAGSADAVVVLSSGISSNGGLADQGLDRLLSGLELIHDGKAPRLVTTRSVRESHGRRLTAVPGQRRVVGLVGVPKWDIVGDVRDTHDEALQSAALLLPAGARHIAVVTSPTHTRRACATFRKVGFLVTCVAAFEHNLPQWHPDEFSERIAAFRSLVHEALGTVKYRAAGWL